MQPQGCLAVLAAHPVYQVVVEAVAALTTTAVQLLSTLSTPPPAAFPRRASGRWRDTGRLDPVVLAATAQSVLVVTEALVKMLRSQVALLATVSQGPTERRVVAVAGAVAELCREAAAALAAMGVLADLVDPAASSLSLSSNHAKTLASSVDGHHLMEGA